MHIPDGFLSTPVWVTLDALAVPAVAAAARKAQDGFDQARIPLLGVMGAFVFAAQMINFPVGAGTSGHLVGGALLAVALGPAAAMVVMTAILAVQALVFQDGGILALGANILNMAVVGVLAGYLPFRLWCSVRARKPAIFVGGALSVLASAVLALAELAASGVRVPAAMLGLSLALFVISAVLEGAITVAVVTALDRIQPGFIRQSGRQPGAGFLAAWGALALAAVLIAAFGVLFAAATPDGLQHLAQQAGIAGRAKAVINSPLADYQAAFLPGGWMRKAAAGMVGLALIYAACLAIGRMARRRSA